MDSIPQSAGKILLEQEKIATRKIVPRQALTGMSSTQLERVIEVETGHMVLSMQAFVLAHRVVSDTFEVQFPRENYRKQHTFEVEHFATWWDQFKGEHVARIWLWRIFWVWFVAKRPARYVTREHSDFVHFSVPASTQQMTFTRKHLYPEQTHVPLDELRWGTPVVVETMTQDENYFRGERQL